MEAAHARFIEVDNQADKTAQIGVSNQVVAKLKVESFLRIQPKTLAKMMQDSKRKEDRGMEISSYGVKMMPPKLFEEEKRMVGVDLGPDTSSMVSSKTTESVASIFQANADFIQHTEAGPKRQRGLYEQDFDLAKASLDSSSSILLIDLRDPEDYSLSHIKGAISYPGPNIARDKFNPQLLEYKNKEGKIIVLYHQDERFGVPDVQLLVDKGWKNLYMLQGGFTKFIEEDAHAEFLTGKVAHKAAGRAPKKPVKSLADCPYF
jgi:rhodanese-related sulfurtransferase